jgi:hypothetical protein
MVVCCCVWRRRQKREMLMMMGLVGAVLLLLFLRGEARLKTKKNNFLLDCYRLIAAFISQLIIYYCIM